MVVVAGLPQSAAARYVNCRFENNFAIATGDWTSPDMQQECQGKLTTEQLAKVNAAREQIIAMRANAATAHAASAAVCGALTKKYVAAAQGQDWPRAAELRAVHGLAGCDSAPLVSFWKDAQP